MKNFILIVNGPICAGKTAVIDVLMKEHRKIFRLSANKIKFLISDYTPDRDRQAVHDCLILIAEKMLGVGMSLVMEGGSMAQGDLNERLLQLGKKNNVAVLTVNIEAPLEVLLKRFNERVSVGTARGSKLSVRNESGFMERYNAYTHLKGTSQKTFDSSKSSPEQICREIMDQVQKTASE